MLVDTHAGTSTLVDDSAGAGASGWRWYQLYCGAMWRLYPLLPPLTRLKKSQYVCSSASRLRSNHPRKRTITMWNTGAQAWIPAGPDDEHAVLIRVERHWAEYWDSNDSKMVRLFAMAKRP